MSRIAVALLDLSLVNLERSSFQRKGSVW